MSRIKKGNNTFIGRAGTGWNTGANCCALLGASFPGFSPFPSCVDDCHEEGRGRGYRGEDGMEEKFLRIFNLAVLLNNCIRIGKRIIIRFDGNRFVNTIVDKIPRAMIGR